MAETLDLTAVLDRDTVKLPDGSTCELRNPQEFGVVAEHHLNMLLQRIDELNGAEIKTDEDAEKASGMLRELAAMIVVGCPGEIDDWACVAIFDFWAAKIKGEGPEGNPPAGATARTTAGSSRNSKRSTVATRKHGSTRRRGS